MEKRAAKWVSEGRHKEFNQLNISNFYDDMGILCLTEKKDNLLMWAHYASGHSGVCLEFDTSKKDILFGSALEVWYRVNYPVYRYVDTSTEDVIVELLRTKSIDWEYEKEWRLFAHPGWPISGDGNHPFDPTLLTGIIFGCRAKDAFKKQIHEMVAERKHFVQLYQAEEKKNEFGLDICPI